MNNYFYFFLSHFISFFCILLRAIKKETLLYLFIFSHVSFAAGPIVSPAEVNIKITPCTVIPFMKIIPQKVTGNPLSRNGYVGASLKQAPDESDSQMNTIPGCSASYYSYQVPNTKLYIFSSGTVTLSLDDGNKCVTIFGQNSTTPCQLPTIPETSRFTGAGWVHYATWDPNVSFTEGQVKQAIQYYIIAAADQPDENNSFVLYTWANPASASGGTPNTPVTVNYSVSRKPACSVDSNSSTISFPEVSIPAGKLQKVADGQAQTQATVTCTGVNGSATNIGLKFTPISPVGGVSGNDTWGLQMTNPGFFVYGKKTSTGGLAENLCTTALSARDNDWVNYNEEGYMPVGTYPNDRTTELQFTADIAWQLCYNPATANNILGEMTAEMSYDYTFY